MYHKNVESTILYAKIVFDGCYIYPKTHIIKTYKHDRDTLWVCLKVSRLSRIILTISEQIAR